ncbi:deuterosome assembly protein 1-like, partial [Mantella aurantiaca]
ADPQNRKDGDAGLESLKADLCGLTAKLNQQDVTMATLREKVCELERGLHVREPNENAQVMHCPEGSNQKSRYSQQEEEPVKCGDGGQNILDEQPERMRETPRLSDTPSQEIQPRLCLEEKHLKMMNRLNNHFSRFGPCGSDWETPSQSLLADQSCLDAILPVINGETSLQDHHQIPEMDLSLIFAYDQLDGTSTSCDGEESFLPAAERFLQDEERRAQDFERILNSHMEELRWQTGRTATKYTPPAYRPPVPAS